MSKKILDSVTEEILDFTKRKSHRESYHRTDLSHPFDGNEHSSDERSNYITYSSRKSSIELIRSSDARIVFNRRIFFQKIAL